MRISSNKKSELYNGCFNHEEIKYEMSKRQPTDFASSVARLFYVRCPTHVFIKHNFCDFLVCNLLYQNAIKMQADFYIVSFVDKFKNYVLSFGYIQLQYILFQSHRKLTKVNIIISHFFQTDFVFPLRNGLLSCAYITNCGNIGVVVISMTYIINNRGPKV